MALETCGKYELRRWINGDFSTEGARVASYSLYENGNQVGAVYTLADNVVQDIKIQPRGKGHGSKFIVLLMKRAKTREYESFEIHSVIGHGSNTEEQKQNFEVMEHMLSKIGFKLIDADKRNWECDLTTFNPEEIGC